MSSLRSSFKTHSKEFKGGSSLTLTNSCYGSSYTAGSSPLQNTTSIPTFHSTPSQQSLTKSINPPLFEVMDNFQFIQPNTIRGRSDSVANTLNTHIDIENPQVWNDNPIILINQEDTFSNNKKNKNLFQKYSLRLPNKLENEYLDQHYRQQILLLRLTNLIGIIAVSYGFTKKAIFMLIAIRILCFNLFAFSIFLSFLKNKNFYRKSYHPLFLFSFTTYFITILLEYKSSTTTFILFLYSVIFSCLYALGCLLYIWMVVCNLMNALCFIIFIFLQSTLDTTNSISYILYILSIFIMGSSHLYVLEKSRKESFVDEKRLGKKAESLREEKEKSEQLLSNILPEFVIKLMNREWIMKRSSQPISKDFPDCSILYCDIVEFTSLASRIDPESLVKLLNEVFNEFDRVVERNGCEKIKTDGDAYVCASGLTIKCTEHYKAMVNTAIEILNLEVLKTNCLQVPINLRVGVATGSVIGGVIGVQKFQFDVWGEAIALAHSLEQTGSPGKIQIAEYGIEKLPIDSYNIQENMDRPLGINSFFIIPTPKEHPDNNSMQQSSSSNNNNNDNETIEKANAPIVSSNNIVTPKITITPAVELEQPPSTAVSDNILINSGHSNIIMDGCDQKTLSNKDDWSTPPMVPSTSNAQEITVISPPLTAAEMNQNLVSPTLVPIINSNGPLKKSKGKVQFKDLKESAIDDSLNSTHSSMDDSITSSSTETSSAKDDSSVSIDMKPLKNKKRLNIVWEKLKSKFEFTPAEGESKNSISKKNIVEKELTEMDKDFRKYTAMNYYIVQFRKFFVEKEFHKFVIRNTLIETKFFVVVGLILHSVFYIDDVVMKSQFVYQAQYIYLAMGIIFVIYFILSFTKLFHRPVVYQLAFFLLLLLFGISTIIELIRHGNPLARSSLTRVCCTLFYVNVFHSLNFISISFLNLFIFSFFFIASTQLSSTMVNHMYLTDYIGIVIVLVIQLFSSYMMKKAMRNAWVIKSKVKFKSLVLNKEREKSAKLLENILPNSISEKLMSEGKGNGMLIAQNYPQVAIMFINIVGFERLPESQEASSMINNMNTIFSTFDGLLARFSDLEKIKTIGTAYMVVGGLKQTLPKNFLFNMADMALTAKSLVKNLSKEQLCVQIGISIGPCVAGCIGLQRAKFDIWGDTANISSRMQTSAPSGKIQVTKEVYRFLRKGFYLEERGTIRVKGKGDMNTYFLTAKKGSQSQEDTNGYNWPTISNDLNDFQRFQFSGSYVNFDNEMLQK